MENSFFLCPKCGKELVRKGKSLLCENRHCYDIAKSGYVNLLPVDKKNSLAPGDNKDMIKARVRVMEKGYYDPLCDYINNVLSKTNVRRILDAGCGTGYITHKLKSLLRDAEIAGTDISKYAIEQASKLYKDVEYAVASSKRLPIADGKCDAVICAFAPVYAEEFYRVLSKGGIIVRVVPDKEHLLELKEYLYETARPNEEDEEVYEGFTKIEEKTVCGEFYGDADDIKALVKMTPYYYHTSVEKLSKLDKLENLKVRTEFRVFVWQKI